MVKHIVMFKLLDFAEGADKSANAKKMKELLETLPSKIDYIKYYEIGINVLESDRAWDVVLISAFDTIEDVQNYIVHPEHQKAAEFILKVREISKTVDFVCD